MKRKIAILTAYLAPVAAFAQDSGAAMSPTAAAYWGAGICMGLAAAVAAFSQSRAASSALESIGRNPASAKPVFVPLLLSLALMESIALFAFLVANNLAGK